MHVKVNVIEVVDVGMAKLLPGLLLQKLFEFQLSVASHRTQDLHAISHVGLHRALTSDLCTHRVVKKER